MNEVLKSTNTPTFSSNPSGLLVEKVGNHFSYAMNKEELEAKLMKKIHNFILNHLSDINFKEKIDNSWEVRSRPEIDVFIPFLSEIFREILKNLSLTNKEEFILSKIGNKEDLCNTFAVQAFDLFNIIMFEQNFGLDNNKGIQLIHNDIITPKEDYGHKFNKTLSGKIITALLGGSIDPDILYDQIMKTYTKNIRKTNTQDHISQETIDWLQGIKCIMKYKFKPALHDLGNPSFGGDKESLFYLGDYFQMGKYIPKNKKRNFQGKEKTNTEELDLEYVELIISSLLERFGNLDFESALIEHGKANWLLTCSRVNEFFDDTINNMTQELLIGDIFPETIFERDGKDFINNSLGSFLGTGIADVFTMFMLHINFGISKETSSRILFMSMRDGKKKNPISQNTRKLVSVGNILGRDKLIKYIDVHLNQGYYTSENPQCPYFKSIQKKEFINTLWGIFETKLFPDIQRMFCKNEIKTLDEFFLLGRYKKEV